MTHGSVTGYPFNNDRAAGYGPEPAAKRSDEVCWCETPLYPARGCCPACVKARAEDAQPSHLLPCGCLPNDAGAHRVGCPDHPEGVRGR